MNIVIPDNIQFTDEAKNRLAELNSTIYEDLPDQDQVLERIKDAEIVTANYIDIRREEIDHVKNLKYIIAPTAGYDWIDYKYARTKKIPVLNCPTFTTTAVAEHALMLILGSIRRLAELRNSLLNDTWAPEQYQGSELFRAELGIVGAGRIGSLIATRAQAFGMKIRSLNSKSTKEQWDKLLRESDIICLCLPKDDSTFHIISKPEIEKMKHNTIIVNIGRGSTIDTGALIDALESGRIAGAGLDVFEDEPSKGYPGEQILRLANMPNVIATPHTGAQTIQAKERLSLEVIKNINSCLINKPVNVVN